MKILLAIGSNVRQTQNIAEAKRRLRRLLPSIVFGQEVWTDPVGLQSDRFLNLLAYADTTFSPAELQQRLKQIECEMGDSHENHQGGRVLIDIDLAEYDGQTIKEVVWLKHVQPAKRHKTTT